MVTLGICSEQMWLSQSPSVGQCWCISVLNISAGVSVPPCPSDLGVLVTLTSCFFLLSPGCVQGMAVRMV